MTNEEIIQEIVREKGYVSSKILKEKNIPSWYLSNMVRKDLLRRIDRGIYVNEKGIHDEYFFFQYLHTKSIYSYSNALYLQGLTDQIPTRLEVTVYQGYNTHRFDKNVIAHYVKKDVHNLGVIDILSPYGNSVNVYNKERTLCDLVSSKKIIESEVFKKAFQTYFQQMDKDVHKLMKYATKLGIESEMFTLIEVLS